MHLPRTHLTPIAIFEGTYLILHPKISKIGVKLVLGMVYAPGPSRKALEKRLQVPGDLLWHATATTATAAHCLAVAQFLRELPASHPPSFPHIFT